MSRDLIAKLMANENIDVVRDNVNTACFDVLTRVLILPQWETSKDVDDMMVCHEVGHALYTPETLLNQKSSEGDCIHHYINILEDIRIEKLMKLKYPGIKKVMLAGYAYLNDIGFFLPESERNTVNSLLLIDKINIYYKVGISSGVYLQGEELRLYKLAEKTTTPDDVIALANEIYEYSKHNHVRVKVDTIPTATGVYSISIGGSDTNPLESNKDSEEVEEDNSTSSGEDNFTSPKEDTRNGEMPPLRPVLTDKELTPKTKDNFDGNLAQLVAPEGNQHSYLGFTGLNDFARDVFINYKKILETTGNDRYASVQYDTYLDAYKEFQDTSNKAVRYMVKEYHMKKAATVYRRTQTAKSGSLDMGKIYAHKISDDLFKRLTIKHDGESHGMLFLLDWSASMKPIMQSVVEQMLVLTDFCRVVKIPFQVLAFTSRYTYTGTTKDTGYTIGHRHQLDVSRDTFHLLELLSSDMSSNDYNTMSRRLFSVDAILETGNGKMLLGQTPLDHALVVMQDYIGKFAQTRAIEKMTFITLTDGESHKFARNPDGWGCSNHIWTVVDNKTKKQYPRDNASMTTILLSILKDRYPSMSSIGFYMVPPRVAGKILHPNDLTTIRKNRVLLVDDIGRDVLYYMLPQNIQNDEVEVTPSMTSRKIASVFSKSMKANQLNKILLSNFIKTIA